MPLIILMTWMMLEMFSFIAVACLFGFGPALLLCLLSACAGIGILRVQGAAVFRTLQAGAAGLRTPRTLPDTLVVALAALLLIVPGFLSDIVAIVLLIPRFRLLLHDFRQRRKPPDPDIIDGDYEKIDDGRLP